MLEDVQYNTLWLADSWGQIFLLCPWALRAMFPYAWPPAKKQAENINISYIVVTCQGLYLNKVTQ